MSARGKALREAPGSPQGRALEGDGIGVDEAAVIARVRAGEPEAYAELVRAFTGVALRAAAALGAGSDAEDVVQQSFFKAYCALGRFRDGAAFKPWLLAIVANETRNTVRSAARQRSVAGREAALTEPEPLIAESADPAVAALERERRAALLAALDRLGPVDPDDVRPQVGQHHRRVGAGDVAGEVDDANAVEGRPLVSQRGGRSARGDTRHRRTAPPAPSRA